MAKRKKKTSRADKREEKKAGDVTPLFPCTKKNTRFPDYLSWVIPSQSTLKWMDQSPAHYKAAVDGIATVKVTDDMLLGSALHAAFLEPRTLKDHVVCYTGSVRRGQEWEAFKAEHASKYILTPGRYEKMLGMVQALREHPFVKQWSARMESVEVAATGMVDGLYMKGRCDALTDSPGVDLKKVDSTDPLAVQKKIINFGYDIQCAAYRELFNVERWVLLMVEDSPPFDIVPYELDDEFLDIGRTRLRELIALVKACEKSDVWPSRWPNEETAPICPPPWAAERWGERAIIT